jgi:predicted ATP-grasp superfamily ATP-dependent carboligase
MSPQLLGAQRQATQDSQMHSPGQANPRRRRILLSEGSSLSARQAITTLGLAGHEIEVCDPAPICIGRFSRFVRRFHRCPGLGHDPVGYLDFLLDLLAGDKFDVLLPTHEQGYLLAKVAGRLVPLTGIALPAFEDYVAAHGKASFSRLLTELRLPQPHAEIVASAAALRRTTIFPAVVKTGIGTASRGVRFVRKPGDLDHVTAAFENDGAFGDEVIVQALEGGYLERAQAVFCHGHLVGAHAYRQIAQGAGGGDTVKESVSRPQVRAHLAQIGERLNWHGALSVDYLLDESRNLPLYIDCNPRLVEPVNALFSGVDLAGLLLAVSLGETPDEVPASRPGTRTHMSAQGLLGCALRGGSRSALAAEAWHLWHGDGPDAGGREELTPVGLDPWSVVPLAYVALHLLVDPRSATRFAEQTSRSHQLNRMAVRIIQEKIEATPLASGQR